MGSREREESGRHRFLNRWTVGPLVCLLLIMADPEERGMSLSGMLYEVLVLLLELLCCPASPEKKARYTCASIFALRKVPFRGLIEA
jgi:hypothetical protein